MIRRPRDFRPSFRPAGAVVIGLGVAIAGCAGLSELIGIIDPPSGGRHAGTVELLISAAITIGAGLPLYLYGGRGSADNLTRRQAVLTVALIWVFSGIFGAIPFVLAGVLGPVDAFFEAVSGLTTTGATVVQDIEGTLTRPLLLWRSLIQWLGGMGIVVLFVAVFPSVGAGGKHLFKGEVPGTTTEGLKPRIAETSFELWKLYAFFTILLALLLWWIPAAEHRLVFGMGLFESICHAFTAMSTGGFSTRDASVGAYNNASIEYTLAVFMLIGSANYGLYYAAIKGRTLASLWHSSELRLFMLIVLVCTLAMTIGNFGVHHQDLELAFRRSLFMVATTISSTGYGTDDYTAYLPGVFGLMILLMFIGGCSGSTAGGLKVERILLLTKQSWMQVRHSFRPAVVEVVRVDKRPVSAEVLGDVAALVALYAACLLIGTVAISFLDGVPAQTSFGAMLTSLSNMGPAPFHIGADNFAAYSAGAKVLFSLAMLFGRLEFFTLFALFVPELWRR